MAVNTTQTGRVHHAMDDSKQRELDATDARQGVVSGRVVTIMIVSMALVAIIFAMLWLTGT